MKATKSINCPIYSPFSEHARKYINRRRLHIDRRLPQPKRMTIAHFLVGEVDVREVAGDGHPALELVARFLF